MVVFELSFFLNWFFAQTMEFEKESRPQNYFFFKFLMSSQNFTYLKGKSTLYVKGICL